jgi:ATP-dependent helicase HrpB
MIITLHCAICLLFAIKVSAFTAPIKRYNNHHQNGFASLHLMSSPTLLDAIINKEVVQSLPIYSILNDVRSSLESKSNLLLQAAPGAGKTTLIPLILPGKTIIIQPRRVATRSASSRMATLLDEPVGQSIGYAIRGESRQSAATQVLVMTDGVLLNMLQQDPELNGYDTVILDEFHERGVGSDTALALLREVQSNYREDLKIVVMSATLFGDTTEEGGETIKSKLTRVLGGEENCNILQSEGRQYPITMQYSSRGSPPLRALVRDTKLLVKTIADAIESGLLKAPEKGDILAFLPGAKEIRMTVQELQSRKLDVDVLPLYSALPKADQDKATYKSNDRRRVIVSSPIAEASLTIERVTCVVDSGLQRQPKYDANTGLPHLVTVTCSKDAAIQRAGRAGRTRDGYCIRLFTESEFENLSMHATPEISSTDLVPTTLLLTGWGCTSANEIIEDLSFLDPPPKVSLDKAYQMLVDLEALEEYKLPHEKRKRYKMTRHGEEIVHLPTHPRFASTIVKSAGMEMQLAAAVTSAALVEDVISSGREANLAHNVRDILKEGPNSFNGKQLINFALRLGNEAKSAIISTMESPQKISKVSECVGPALLPGFVDLIAQRKGDASYGGSTYMLALGRSARLDGKTDEGEYVIVVDTSTSDDGKTRIRSYSKIDLPTLEAVATEQDEIYTVASQGYEVRKRRVKKVGSLILSSATLPSPNSKEITDVLLGNIKSLGGISALLSLQTKKVLSEIEDLLQRIKMAQQSSTEHDWPACFESLESIRNGNSSSKHERVILDIIEPWLGGAASLKGLNLLSTLTSQLSPKQQNYLDTFFPTKITAPDGSLIDVDYSSDNGPIAMAKLQQFFGQQVSPVIGPPDRTTPLTLLLLSPSGKPSAQTRDLSFFWEETYPSVRAEMRGRYPKHPWPSDPLNAAATRMTKKQTSVLTNSGGAETDNRKERNNKRKKR